MKLIFFAIVLLYFPLVNSQRRGKVGSATEGRIVGGEETRIEAIPYQASMQYYNSHICGGAIISKEFVVTASHCKFFKSFSVQIVKEPST